MHRAPGIPCALSYSGERFMHHSGVGTSRECRGVSAVIARSGATKQSTLVVAPRIARRHYKRGRGWPGHLARRRASRFCPAMTRGDRRGGASLAHSNDELQEARVWLLGIVVRRRSQSRRGRRRAVLKENRGCLKKAICSRCDPPHGLQL